MPGNSQSHCQTGTQATHSAADAMVRTIHQASGSTVTDFLHATAAACTSWGGEAGLAVDAAAVKFLHPPLLHAPLGVAACI